MKSLGLNSQGHEVSDIAPKHRDLRIDFWRGVALLTIFINHVPGNIFEPLTHRNFGLSDSAELFVFLAGFSAALAYFPKFVAGDAIRQSWRCMMRAVTLYIAHIVSLIAAIALFAVAAESFGDVSFMRMINIGPVMDDPLTGFLGIATLGHQVGYFNILPLYVLLVAGVPLIMLLARIDIALPLFASLGLYIAAQLFSWNLPSYPNEGVWFFNPFAWQLLFVTAFCIGCIVRSGLAIPYSRIAYGVALAYLAASLAIAVWYKPAWPHWNGLPAFLWSLDKSDLPLPRLLHILALAYAAAYMPGAARFARALKPDNPFVVMGRNALPVFCAGSLLSMVGLILRDQYGSHALLDLLIVCAGFLSLVALAHALDWSKRHIRPRHAALGSRAGYRLSH
ncbi:MAG TPA: OpgC domain-containing protein [Alphaproteobacteria bacterium]|nr:OpgC domain-containing protein [Alphaproteobacteria bacterium]